jgi:very-short-patch-repair endonuclease
LAPSAHAPSPGTPPNAGLAWIDRALRSWLELAERSPRLPLALILEPHQARLLLAQAQGTRLQVRLQNALVWLPEPAAAPAPDPERAQAGAIEHTRAFLGRALAAEPELSSAFESAVHAYRAVVASEPAAATGQDAATPEAEDRARSQAERLLFLALERAPETRGLFVLNQRLDVRFGRAPMEVDLYCATLGLAVEVDGYHHFRDLDAYRRDRRKDLLLQSLDHMVVRCLAEDVVLALDQVLAAIAGALAHRRRRINGIDDPGGLESE